MNVFGFTATPVKNKLIDMYSCDNSIGGVLYQYDFPKALDDRIICDYSINICFYTLNDED